MKGSTDNKLSGVHIGNKRPGERHSNRRDKKMTELIRQYERDISLLRGRLAELRERTLK